MVMTQGDSVSSLARSGGPQHCAQQPSDAWHPGMGAGLFAKSGFTLINKIYQFVHNKQLKIPASA